MEGRGSERQEKKRMSEEGPPKLYTDKPRKGSFFFSPSSFRIRKIVENQIKSVVLIQSLWLW